MSIAIVSSKLIAGMTDPTILPELARFFAGKWPVPRALPRATSARTLAAVAEIRAMVETDPFGSPLMGALDRLQAAATRDITVGDLADLRKDVARLEAFSRGAR
jgi:hypothetical protein